MKLCRFELTQDPGRARSGIYHDGRVYETDGEKAIGVHEPSKVRFLAPVGVPPSLRIFDGVDEGLTFRYGNASALLDPGTEIDAPPGMGELEPELRIASVLSDSGEQVDADEADTFLLGVTLTLGFYGPEFLDTDPMRALDMPRVIGPLLTTPDDLTSDPLKIRLTVNGEFVWNTELLLDLNFANQIGLASRNMPVRVADLFLSPPIAMPRLRETSFKRELRPRDTVQVVVEPLGALSASIV